MDDIKVGEYVKTNKGEICKVLGINKEIRDGNRIYSHKSYNLDNRKGSLTRAFIKNHSFNIAELIKVNDFVNGHRVANIKNDEGRIEIGLDTDHMINYYIEEQDIKTILTHEQYEINCYTVKEE